MSFRKNQHRFPLLRYFSLISLVAILVVALLILTFYRYMVINTITDLGEAIDVSVANTALNSIEDELAIYLDRQKQKLNGSGYKTLSVGGWSVTYARMQMKVSESTNVTYDVYPGSVPIVSPEIPF